MLEKDHFKNSSCIYTKVKSKAEYLEIRFLSFAAVTPAGTLGLCMSEQGGKEGTSLAAGAPLASLPVRSAALPTGLRVLCGHGRQCCLCPLHGRWRYCPTPLNQQGNALFSENKVRP